MNLLTSAEAARELKLHPETLRRLTREGKIPCMRIGGTGRYRYDFDAITAVPVRKVSR